MAKYRVDRTCFINNTTYKEGDIVEIDGEPMEWMEPVVDEAEEKPKAKPRGRQKQQRDGDIVSL